jgi:hypothetical protein
MFWYGSRQTDRFPIAQRDWITFSKNESQLIMSPDEEFVRERHPQADLVEILDPAPNECKWCVHYHAEVDSKIMGRGNSIDEAWSNARMKCMDDPII